jgi:hypothetical protein
MVDPFGKETVGAFTVEEATAPATCRPSMMRAPIPSGIANQGGAVNLTDGQASR